MNRKWWNKMEMIFNDFIDHIRCKYDIRIDTVEDVDDKFHYAETYPHTDATYSGIWNFDDDPKLAFDDIEAFLEEQYISKYCLYVVCGKIVRNYQGMVDDMVGKNFITLNMTGYKL